MKAMGFNRYGGPEVLEEVELRDCDTGVGEVRVEIRAAGVNPFDVKVRRGDMDGIVPIEFPYVPGTEFAGTVREVGSEVEGLAVGEAVLGFCPNGGYAEAITLDASRVAGKPDELPWPQAGALSGGGQTAYVFLEEIGVGPGETVLIHAAAGGVGTMAVQLARIRGANVIGTASRRNHDRLRELGATPVEYGEGLVERVREAAPGGVDAALDLIGGDAVAASLELVADRSRIATTTAFAEATEHGFVSSPRTQRSSAILAQLAELAAKGELAVDVEETFPLERAGEAQARVEQGHVRGKVVLTTDRLG